MGFENHFGGVSSGYAKHRPAYPAALFPWLASLPLHRHMAWDCATGTGQIAVPLAQHFSRVVATDGSAEQVAAAKAAKGVQYRIALAEASGLGDRSVDLVTIGQALHWFDLDAFWTEVRRVLRPGGAVCALSYGIVRLASPAADAVLAAFYRDVIGPLWPPERHHVENGYVDLSFPFQRIEAPELAMEVNWSAVDLVDYMKTWSAGARLTAAEGNAPWAAVLGDLEQCWPGSGIERVYWPLTILAGRP